MIVDTGRSLRVRENILAVGALLIFVALRFLPALMHRQLYAPFQDNVFIYGPLFAETSRIALHGENPFYLPSFSLGFPLFQSPHYSPFYPFYFFGWLTYGGPLRSLYVLTYLSMFHAAILGINFFVMLRSARVSCAPAVMGAALGVFAYNTDMYAGWITIAASYTWLPLAIAGAILLVREPRRLLGILLLGTSAGMLALASASQSVAHALLFFLIFFAASFVWSWRKRDFHSALRLLISVACALAIAIGLSGVSVVPVYLGITEMIRHIGHGFVLGHQHLPWQAFNVMQLSPSDWPNILLHPGAVEVVGSPYVGPLGVAGIICALIFFRRLDSLGKLFVGTIGGIGLYGLLSGFGTHYGLAYLNYHIPFIENIREAGRHLSLFVIGTVFLVGVGFEQLGYYLSSLIRAWRHNPRGWILPIAGTVGFAIVIICHLTPASFSFHERLAVLLLTPIAAGLALVLRCHVYPWMLAGLLISSASFVSPPRILNLSVSEFVKPTNTESLQILQDLKNKLGRGDCRIDFIDHKLSPFTWGMNASYFGFDSFYNRLTPQPYQPFRFSLQHDPPVLREMMGSRYVLCSPDDKPDDRLAIKRFETHGYTLFENPAYMQRLAIVHSVAGVVANEKEFIDRASQGFNFRDSLCLQESDAQRLKSFLVAESNVSSTPRDRLSLLTSSTNRISVRVESSRPGVVILNEWFTPAWHARVNGRARPTIRANEWQVGVPVEAGGRTVEFTYRPRLCWILLIVNRVTWVLLAITLVGYIGWKIRSAPDEITAT